MNTVRTSSSAPRPSAPAPRPLARAARLFRAVFLWLAAASVLAGLFETASLAGSRPASAGGTGAALALAAQLRSDQLRLDAASGHTPSGRSLLPPSLMRPGAIRKSRAATASTTPIPGAVQTFDIFNPAPAFRPLYGYANADGSLGNNPQNPPLYAPALLPTNLTPVWSQDETFLVYSSNRTATGAIAPDGRFHLWAISVNGGETYQITTSAGPAGGGEFFPTLNSSNNTELAFTSDAQTPGVQNLYAIQFSLTSVVGGLIGNVSDPAFVTSPTNATGTGFDQVGRPTISPADSNLIVFSAHSTAGANAGHAHLYFLYLTTGGFDPNNRTLPAKLTDGQADDTDPAYSNDGQYLAFASTAAAVDSQSAPNNAFSSDPNTSQSITSIASGTTAASNRSLFLLSGGVGATGFGTPPAGLRSVHGRMTQAGTDDFGPAWSFITPNQYTNTGIGFEYLAFARGAAQGQPHDIYYIQSVRGVNSQGETGRSYEAATSVQPASTTLYQVAAGSAGGYASYTGDTAPSGFAFATGGALGTNTTAVTTANDPAAPAGLYSTFRMGGPAVGTAPADQFTYTLPNLTPGASYTVRLHFADPADAVAGKRVFTVNVNNGQALRTVDIAAAAPGANTAYVLTIPNITATNAITPPAQQGQIRIVFAKTAASTDEPLVNGIEVLSSPAAATSSGFGGDAGTSQPGAPAYISAIGGSGGINLGWSAVSGAASYNIYRSPNGSFTGENRPNTGGSGLEGNVPYRTGITGTTFVDTNVTQGAEYFYQVTAIVQQSLTPEASGSNGAIKLVTEQNAPSTANAYDDIYPSWSPFRSIFSITYSSNRSVSYNDPTSGIPSETAISLARGQVTPTYSVGAAYAGILISQVLNLDPPTLLRFSSTETVHVQPGNSADPVNGTPTKFGLVTGGQAVTLTVRLSDREAGIDEGNVYLQIKDPDSKYQDSQRLEHKVFAKDLTYYSQSNRPASDTSTFSSDYYLGIDGPGVLGNLAQILDTWPTYGVGTYVFPRGALGGFWDASASHLYIGKSGGGNNQLTGVDARMMPPISYQFTGDDPNLFIPWGPEYECQFLNAQYAGTDSVLTDYGTPYYLAGVDDQQAFSGAFSPARPEWLRLTRVAAASQDNKGGVLYTATWTTPLSGSDFFLDVIAYDKAVFPTLPAQTSPYEGSSVNWRIYDNVGGFSTDLSIGNNDILVVSDYALGQKFAGTTFNGSNGNLNLVPKLYGAESYFTDVDVNVLPDTVFAGYPTLLANPQSSWAFGPYLQKFGTGVNAYSALSAVVPTRPNEGWRWLNGLGVGSYSDGVTSSYNQGSAVDGVPFDNSQKYSVWRILARGPVPQQTLNSYLPTKQPQPAVVDLQGPAAYHAVPAATVLDAHRCVIWVSPYTGDLLTDPGSLDDPGSFNVPNQPDRQSTQTILRNFVKGGGRLFLNGQDVASGLTLGGTVANTAGSFLPDVLNATWTSSNGGSDTLVGTANRITGDPGYDGLIGGYYPDIVGSYAAGFLTNYQAGLPSVYPYQDNLVLGSSGQSDGSLDQRLSALRLPSGANLLGQIDTIAPANGAQTVMTYGAGGASAMVIHDDPYLGGTAGTFAGTAGQLPNGGTGSRVVYGAFGLEGLSNDTYAPVAGDPNFPLSVPPAAPRNPRPNILHNIVTYLRTGGVSGLVTQTAGTGAGAGQGVAGVTVYLVPISGVAPPTRATFSATTDQNGSFAIAGVEPGVYTLAAYKAGYSRAVTNAGVAFTVEGDVNVSGAALTLSPLPPANFAGVVQDAAKHPINGAVVTFTSQDKSVTRTVTTVNGSVTSNPADNYFLQSVPVTAYTATATGPLNSQGLPEYTAATAPDAPLSAGVTAQANTTTDGINFTLTASPASLSGAVVNSATGAGIVGASVTLKDSTGKTVATQTTVAGGAYSFTGIVAATAAANFTVSATAPAYAPNTVTQPLQAGSVYTGVNVPLTAIPSGNIHGTVTDQRTGLPLPGATVTFTLAGGVTQTATTGTDGTYTLTAIPTGTYSGTAAGPATGQAYVPSAAQSVTVANATTQTANFALVPVLATLTGTVTDSTTNLALSGVTITVTDGSGAVVTTNPAPLTTGANGSYTATLAPGTYFITASKAGYNSQTSAATVLALGATVTASFKLTSSIGTLGGLVTDQNGTTLVSGATVTVLPAGQTTGGITLTTAGSSTTGPDGSPINYTGQLTQGAYTVTVTKGSRTSAAKTITIIGGAFNRLDFSAATGLPPLHTFGAGIQFVSTPYDYSALGFDGLFGALNTAASGTTPNGNRSHVAVWNPLTGAYALDPTAPADTLRLGVGYWVYLKNPVAVTQQGAAAPAGTIAVTLGAGWNQIGVPNPSSAGIPIGSLRFDNGSGGTISFTQATSSQYNLVTQPLYAYAGGGYQALSATDTLKPWNGYWIYVNSPATLEIPTQ